MSDATEISSNALEAINNEYTSTPIGITENAPSSNGDTDSADNAPRILCNELIVNPNNSKSFEKLDELSSLEREIAKMHHVDETQFEDTIDQHADNKSSSKDDNNKASKSDVSEKSDEKYPSKEDNFEHTDIEAKLDVITSGETALEHEDLIAVLKGLDSTTEETLNNSGSGPILEGVTIEGEGEYQIMEVIDEDSNATEDNAKQIVSAVSTSDTIIQSLNKKLTPQEERALALEQIEGLKTAQRRRKQDIKPIKKIDSTLDIISALEADWSEHEDETTETQKLESKTKKLSHKNKTVATTACENKNDSPLITSVVVIPSSTASVSSAPITISTSTEISSENTSVNSNNNTKTEEKISLKSSAIEGVIETKTEEDTQVVSSQSGFRRTRIIKRKIIWDPDAPETTFSYAKLVKTNNSSKTKLEPALPATAIKKGSTTITPIKKEILSTTSQNTAKKAQRPTTPKAKRIATDLNPEKTVSVKTEKSNLLLKNVVEKDVTKPSYKTEESDAKVSPEEIKNPPTATLSTKRRSQTPVSNGPSNTTGAKKKKITEVDRLMGDEGAVNMLNSLEKLEATLGSGEAKPSRPMMRSRAATICEKMPRKETTSPARSTTTTSPTTTNIQSNKGKRTPKSRASSSWDYVYKKKKQDFDDSLIIRRRSNSSYSSTTSLNRLSLDGPPAAISGNNLSNSSAKRSDSVNSSPAATNDNPSSKISPSTLNSGKSTSSSKSRSIPPTGKSFEFAKPENKKSQKRTKSPAATLTNDMKKAAPTAAKRNNRSPATTSEEKSKDNSKTQSTKSPTNIKEKKETTPPTNAVSDVIVKKSSKVAQILFSTNKAKLSNTFTIQMLNKLVDILDKLASDPDCHVVVIGTNDAHFCQGIDITDLITIADEKRKNYAINLANSAKNYLKTLAIYPKPVIAGVTGSLSNFGVIQLALFDVVIASDKTTFEMPYAKMGQTPEGYCLWHNMNKIRGSFKTKLFWLCEKVQSTEAALAGLVNKLTASNKVNDDALMTAKRMASYSVESYRAMKKTVINNHLDVIVNSLDEEFNTIIRQWTSNECLENLKKYMGQD